MNDIWIGKLLDQGLISKYIGTYIAPSKKLLEAHSKGKVEIELVP